MDLLTKLGSATGAGVVTVGYPGGVDGLEGRELVPGSPVPAGSVVVVFTETRSRFDERGPLLVAAAAASRCWIAYPKLRRSSPAGDLTRDVVRAAAADLGLRTVAQVAVDDVWSALRLRPS